MNEVAIFRQMKNIAKGDLEDNEEFVMLKDYKDLKHQLQSYKDKEEKLRELYKELYILDYLNGRLILNSVIKILNEGSDE